MANSIQLTSLIENRVYRPQLRAEHGLSFWIEYGGKHILFDTGQSDLVLYNARLLGIDLSAADAIVLSHGHYDHTGGLGEILDIAPESRLYFHPAALEAKYSIKNGRSRQTGISESLKNRLLREEEAGRVCYTEKAQEVGAGIMVTGEIPRKCSFEASGGRFYLDSQGEEPDRLVDDQALFLETGAGVVVVFGCAHAGAVNTLYYVKELSKGRIHAVLGGMHLVNAGDERIARTIEVMERIDIKKIGAAHCTGLKASRMIWDTFGGRCVDCSVGSQIIVG